MINKPILIVIIGAIIALGVGMLYVTPWNNETPSPTHMPADRSSLQSPSAAVIQEFDRAAYDAAVASKMFVALYFYTDSCSVCREEFSSMEQVFTGLPEHYVAGFRVHFNDRKTSPEAEELAREHGVTYENTKVFVRSGQRILKTSEAWDTRRYVEEIVSALSL